MLDDLRDHEASSSAEKRHWMDTDAVEVLARALGLAAVALVIGVSASIAVGYPISFPTPVVAAPR
jgi:hypothetical protein